MRKILIFLLALMMIGAASALPRSGAPAGVRFSNLLVDGDTELTGSLSVGGVDIAAGSISYDEFVSGMITNETAINTSIDALTLAAYTNETAINTSLAAQAASQVTNETAINLSIISRSNGVQLSSYQNETDINETIAAQAVSQVTNETAINTTAANVALGQTWQNNTLANLALGQSWQNSTISGLVVPLASFPYTADAVDQAVFTAAGGWVLTSVVLTPTVAGTGEGAATVMVKLCDSAEAPASGEAMLNSTLDLEGTIHTPQTGALTTYTGVSIPTGKIVALDFTGTLTSSVGVVTLYGKRA